MLGQCSSTVLIYNALAICTNNLTNTVTITCGIQPYQYCYYDNESVTIITCAVVICLDMYALASGVHTYQTNHSHTCYIRI